MKTSKPRRLILAYLGRIQEIIEEGKRDGTIRRDVVATTASVLFLGMILPAVVLWNVTEGRFDMIEHVESAWPAFARSIAADGSIFKE